MLIINCTNAVCSEYVGLEITGNSWGANPNPNGNHARAVRLLDDD